MNKFSNFKEKDESYGFLFWRTYSLWNRRIKKALSPLKLSHTQSVILNVIAYLQINESSISQKMISKHSNIDVMTLSTSIKSLIKSGYVRSVQNEIDPRSNEVSLTEEGLIIQRKAMKLIEDVDKIFFEKNGIDIKAFTQSLYELVNSNSYE